MTTVTSKPINFNSYVSSKSMVNKAYKAAWDKTKKTLLAGNMTMFVAGATYSSASKYVPPLLVLMSVPSLILSAISFKQAMDMRPQYKEIVKRAKAVKKACHKV